MSESSARRQLIQRVVEALDPKVVPEMLARYARASAAIAVRPDQQIVLVGHRSAGKSRLLPMISELTGRPGIDLDAELARTRELRDWVTNDLPGFRAAERATFSALPPGHVVAAGGGFLSLHGDLLAPHVAVLVPVSFETYRERLLADATRPRLRPELTVDEEIRAVFFEREAVHLRASTVHLADFLRGAVAG